MVTSAAPVTKTKTSFPFWLTSKVSLLAVVNSTERQKSRKFTKRPQTSRKSVKRLRDFPGREGSVGRGLGAKRLPCQWTPARPPPPASGVVLSMIWNDLVENQKLKIDFNFPFFDLSQKQKTKPCHRLQHCRRNKIASQFDFYVHCQ